MPWPEMNVLVCPLGTVEICAVAELIFTAPMIDHGAEDCVTKIGKELTTFAIVVFRGQLEETPVCEETFTAPMTVQGLELWATKNGMLDTICVETVPNTWEVPT